MLTKVFALSKIIFWVCLGICFSLMGVYKDTYGVEATQALLVSMIALMILAFE